jgi:site-specific DNA-methyltransferase (adenine-specific)
MTDAPLALAVRSVGALAPSRWFEVDAQRLALRFRPDTPYDAWEAETIGLLEVARGIQWLVGDALAFGEERWPDRFAQVLDADRYAYESVERMARVARAIEPQRRRPTVGFYAHMAVAALPVASQEQLLDHAEEHRSTVQELRALARAEHRRLERAAAALRPVPVLAGELVSVAVGDARALPLETGSVDAIITSPPYGLDSETVAKYRVPDAASAWVQLMVEFCREAFRVLGPQGRLLVNVPIDTTTGGFRPTYAQLVAAALACGFSYRTTIHWADGHLGKSVARGSIDSPGAINVVAPCEAVLVVHKGAWGRPAGSGTSDLRHEEWVGWCNGDWVLPGETRPWEGFEAAFPSELPRRLLKLFTYREDVVVDPFVGSGTTLAVASGLGRVCYGYDVDPLQVASSTRRLAVVQQGGRRGQ